MPTEKDSSHRSECYWGFENVGKRSILTLISSEYIEQQRADCQDVKMIIREATVDDAREIWKLHMRSVRRLCSTDYAPEQIEAWVNHRTLDEYRERIKRHHCYVAESDSKVVGYARFDPTTSELCSVFVDPDCTRQGVGTRLVSEACGDAVSRGTEYFWLDASLTAVPFYESVGFTREKSTVHVFSGVDLECVRMTRRLHHSHEGQEE